MNIYKDKYQRQISKTNIKDKYQNKSQNKSQNKEEKKQGAEYIMDK